LSTPIARARQRDNRHPAPHNNAERSDTREWNNRRRDRADYDSDRNHHDTDDHQRDAGKPGFV
jgi:hypothetical protein